MSLKNYGLVESIDELAAHCRRLSDSGASFGFDIETGYVGADREKFALHPETALVAGISFAGSTDWARYVPLGHDVGPNLDNVAAARLLWPVLNTGRGVAHNIKFELRHLAKWFRECLGDDPLFGEQVRRSRGYFKVLSDTQVEAYLVAEYPFLGLKPLVEAMFGHKMTELFELFPDLPKNKRKMIRFNVLPLTPQVVEYACEDSLWCLKVHQWYYRQVVDRLLYKVEMAIIIDCCCDMEDIGVAYDWPAMRAGAADVDEFRDRFNAEIMEELSYMVGSPIGINLGSPKQISEVLYDQLGMKTSVYTKSTKDLPKDQRKMSTGKIALTNLAKQHPVVKKILQWKEMTKLHGTFLTKYEQVYNYAEDGHTHPNHLTAFVVTGRFAVSDPPYQQSPKTYHFDLAPAREAHRAHDDAHGKGCTCEEFAPPPGTCFRHNFRDNIIAPPDHYILGYDLSQAELRAIAGEAKEQALLDAFARGDDVHALTAALMLKIKLEDVTKDERDVGKTMNFALLYGMGVKSLADRLAIPIEEAQALMDKYFAAYPNIAAWSAAQVRHGKQYGYVTSRFGRRLPIWEYKSDKRWIQQKGDRACVNYPIQGAATGDYMKIGMVRAMKALRTAGLTDKVRLVMNVHDALEFYVHRSVAPQDVIEVLQPAVIFEVPGWPAMRADWHIAKRWGSPLEVALVDGKLIVKGEKVIEITPAVEEDEDGEEIEVMPDVDIDVLRKVAGITEPQPSNHDADTRGAIARGAMAQIEPGRHLVVTLDEMPDADVWDRFTGYLESHPGPNAVTVSTPEGELTLNLRQGTAVTPSNRSEIAVILGQVTVAYANDDIDFERITRGLVF